MHGRRVAVQDEVDDQVQDAEGQAQPTAEATQQHVFLRQALGQGSEPLLEPPTAGHQRRCGVHVTGDAVAAAARAAASSDDVAHDATEDVGVDEAVAGGVAVAAVVVVPAVEAAVGRAGRTVVGGSCWNKTEKNVSLIKSVEAEG